MSNETAKKEAPVYELPPNNLKLSESAVLKYHAVIPRGHSKDDLLKKTYWAHVARKLKRHSRIEVCADDFTFWGMLVVTDCEATWANVWPVLWVEQDAETKAKKGPDWSAIYTIDNAGSGFRVIDKATGNVLKEGLSSRKVAMEEISELMKKMA
jgi:hypothetical protein